MGSKHKTVREAQKAYWEAKLQERNEVLAERGLVPEAIAKDSVLKKLKAKIKDCKLRLKAIAEAENQREKLAEHKAKKAEELTPIKEKKKKAKEEETAESKTQQKKKAKYQKKKEEKGQDAAQA